MAFTRTIAVAAIFIITAGVSAHAQVRGISDDEIVIGGSFPLTGNLASSGQGHSLGIRVAIEDVNAHGGINGRKLRLILEDDAYVPARTVQNIRKLIDVDKIFALVGMSSSAGAFATLDYITQTKTINVNGYIMNSAVWETFRPTTFSVGQGYPRLVEATVNYLNANNAGLKWGVFVQDDAFGENIMAGVDKALANDKSALALAIKFKRGQQDFSSEMLRMKSAGVTAIYVGGVFNEYLAIVREAKRLAMDVKFAFLYSAHNRLLQSLLGEIGQGYIVSDTVASVSEPAGQAFVETAKKYVSGREVEGITRDSFTGYAAASVLIDALKRSGRELNVDGAVAALEETSDLKIGVMGPIGFGNGVRFSNQQVRVLMNDYGAGKFVALTPYH
jgi:branched-chain amino acid transport system substrate-binding protein